MRQRAGASPHKRKVNAGFRHSHGRDPRWARALLGGLLLLAVVIGGSLGLRQWLSFDGSAQSYYQRALEQFENRNYAAAQVDLRNALDKDPGHGKARKLLAKTYLALNQALKAREELALAKELGISQGPMDAAVRYEDAVVRFNRGEYRGAIIQLRKVLETNPDDIVAQLLLGRAYVEIGDGHSAEVQLRKARSGGTAVALVAVPLARAYLLQKKYKLLFNTVAASHFDDGIMGRLHILAGQAHLIRNNLDLAEKAYSQAASLLPESVDPLVGKARVELRRGHFDEAQTLADAAEALAPDAAQVWNLKAEIQRYQHNLEQALAYYDKALELEPGQVESHRGRAAALIDLNRGDEALAALKKSYETSPEDINSAYLYALALARGNQLEQARTVLDKTAAFIDSLDPVFVHNDPATLLISGLINYSANKLEVAYLNLERFVKLRPRHFGGRQLFSAILLQRGEPQRAIEVLLPVVKAVENDPQALVILGNAYNQVRQYDKATRLFERAVELAPDRIKLRAALALSRLASGHQDLAVGDLQSGLEQTPGDAEISMLLGLVYLKQRDYGKALAVAETMIKRQPDNAHTYNLAGTAQLGLGQPKAARELFLQSIKISPGFVPGLINLAKLNLREGNLDAARAGLLNVLETEADDVTALLGLATIDQRLKHFDLALEWLSRARKARPENIMIGLRLVSFYLAVDKPKQALTVAQELEARHPNNLPVLSAMSRIQFTLGNRQAAGDILQHMLQLARDNPRSLQGIALQQLRFGDMDAAEESLHRALQLDAEFIPARSTLVEIALRRKNYAKALELARQLQIDQPDAVAGSVLEGNILYRMRRFEEAAKAYQHAQDQQPSAALLIRVHEAWRSAGSPATALPALEDWIRDHPDAVAVRRALAAAYLDVGRLQMAIKAHEQLLETVVDDAALYNNLASLYQRAGDGRAQQFAEKAYALAPEQPAALDTLGWILASKGESIRALKFLRQAQNRLPDDPRVAYHIAVALDRLGRLDAARRELEKALESGEPFEGADEARDLLRRIDGG